MFKQSGVEDELFRSMETSLIKNQTENKHGFSKVAKAADLLNTAADIFEHAGMSEEAAAVTQILEALAKDLHE
jgi:hypothetical protein